MKTCRYLRWKSYRADATEAEVASVFARNSVPYSCLKTCQPFGDDDQIAAPEHCVSGRGCYEEHSFTKRVTE